MDKTPTAAPVKKHFNNKNKIERKKRTKQESTKKTVRRRQRRRPEPGVVLVLSRSIIELWLTKLWLTKLLLTNGKLGFSKLFLHYVVNVVPKHNMVTR